MSDGEFRESHGSSRPIRELGLEITGTVLEPLIAELMSELERAGIRRLRPRFYLSTEWGVPDDTVAIAIPFYLASPALTTEHAARIGYVEGYDRADILRYLRHETGHAVNYAYRLYEDPEWVRCFGSITQPYVEDYRPRPFSGRFVRHLPGWYAQKHPDEDFAETFAVWLTPGSEWRHEYAGRSEALAKLEYVDRAMRAIGDREPLVNADDLDTDVSQIAESLEEFYDALARDEESAGRPPVSSVPLEGLLRAIFEDAGASHPSRDDQRVTRPAAALIRRLENELMADVYRWTGHFPEETRRLLRHLAARADELAIVYAADHEPRITIGLTAMVTALAMNHVHLDTYFP